MLNVNLASPIPFAEQIRLGIRQKIALGELNPGDPLPTVRQLALELGINLNTVAQAYRLLRSEGLVTTIRGRGTVVNSTRAYFRPGDEVAWHQWQGELRNALISARLAGLSRHETESLFSKEASRIWSRQA